MISLGNMKIFRFLWIVLVAFLLFVNNFPIMAQKSLGNCSDFRIWEVAKENFEHKNYGAARNEFQDFVARESTNFSDKETQAKFYMAMCSMKLNCPKAEQEMESFVKNYPESPHIQSAYFQLGACKYRNKKYKEALLWFNQVDSYFLNDEEFDEYRFKQAYSFLMQKDYETAYSKFYEIIDKKGNYYVPSNYYYAHIAYQNEDYQTALKSFERIQNDPGFSSVVPYYICQIYLLQEQYEQLIAYAPQHLEDANVKRQNEISQMLALAYYRKKEYAKAIPFLEANKEKLVRKNKFVYGYCLYKEKQYEQASVQFEKLGGEDDEMLQIASYCLADCYLKLGNKNGAKVAFANASRMDFEKNIQQDALFNYAKLTYELSYSPFNETINTFDEYLQKYPDSDRNSEAYNYLVKLYSTTKNYSAALRSMRKIKNKTPDIERAYQRVSFLHGLELMTQLKYKEALQAFKNSQKYTHNSKILAEAVYWQAEANYRLGKLNEANSGLELFLLSPIAKHTKPFAQAFYNIAYIKFSQEKYDEALNWFRKFVANANEQNEFVLDAYNRMGDCFFLNRAYQQAHDFYAKATTQKNPDVDYSLFQQALCIGLLNRHADKALLLKQMKEKYPQSEYADDALYELAQTKIKLNEPQKAVSLYQELIEKHPLSSYSAKSMLQLGLMNYNFKNYNEAIHYYKTAIENYPLSEERESAFIGLKNIYVDLNKVDEYFAFVEKSAGSNNRLRVSERDSLSYMAAERLYMSGNMTEGMKALENYLTTYPLGSFRINAQYYKAEAALNQHKYEEALLAFDEVIDQADNLFTEKALLAASRLNYNKAEFEDAKKQYQKLLEIAEIPENKNIAKLGCLRCAYELEQHEEVIATAEIVLETKKTAEEIQREAVYKRAKAYLALNQQEKALSDCKLLAKNVQSLEGAEAKFRIAEIYNLKGKYELAEKEINNFIEMSSPHHYWLAESFLLLAKLFLKRNDSFQAKYTLQSIIDNYDSKKDGIINRANTELNRLLEIEKQKELEMINKEEELQLYNTKPNLDPKQKQGEKPSAKKEHLNLDEEQKILQEMLNQEKNKESDAK